MISPMRQGIELGLSGCHTDSTSISASTISKEIATSRNMVLTIPLCMRGPIVPRVCIAARVKIRLIGAFFCPGVLPTSRGQAFFGKWLWALILFLRPRMTSEHGGPLDAHGPRVVGPSDTAALGD
jgi:hypothetical protein